MHMVEGFSGQMKYTCLWTLNFERLPDKCLYKESVYRVYTYKLNVCKVLNIYFYIIKFGSSL